MMQLASQGALMDAWTPFIVIYLAIGAAVGLAVMRRMEVSQKDTYLFVAILLLWPWLALIVIAIGLSRVAQAADRTIQGFVNKHECWYVRVPGCTNLCPVCGKPEPVAPPEH